MTIQEWYSLSEVKEHFNLEELHDDNKGFKLLLRGESSQRVLSINFESVLSYRRIDEGDLLKSYQQITEGFHKIESSSYLSWFHEESYDSWKDKNVIHYAVYTPNDCVDILSIHPPRIEFD